MSTIFSDLCAFFGLTATAPESLGELFPWLLQILIALGVVLFVFGMIKDFMQTFARGRF